MEKTRKRESARRRAWCVRKIFFGFYALLAQRFSLLIQRVRGREARRCTPKFGTVLTALTIHLFKPIKSFGRVWKNTGRKLTMAWKVTNCTKQWNCNVKCVPHVAFTRMTPSATKGT